MGHAGAIISGGKGTATGARSHLMRPGLACDSFAYCPEMLRGCCCHTDKIAALEAAGVTVVKSPAQMGTAMSKVMAERH